MASRLAIAAALVTVVLSGPARADAAADLELGVARVQAGEFAAAIAPLRAAHEADPSDLDAALLLGIAYYRCGDDARAQPLFAAAAQSADPDTHDGARLFLGLLADRAGDAEAAIGYYDSVSRGGSSLAASGQQLLARGRGERLSAALVIRPEIDSNAAVLPAASIPADGSASDRDLLLAAELHVRPFQAIGLVLDQAVAYRKQAQLTELDMASSVSGASWGGRAGAYRGAIGYHIDVSTLGGVFFQLGQTFDAAGRRLIAGAFAVAASYQLTARTLYPDAYAGYTGLVHTGAAKLSWLAGAWELELAGLAVREATSDPTLAATGAGGQIAARLRLGRIDMRVVARAIDRRYDAAAQGRRDLQVRGEAALYVDITSHLGAVIGATMLDDHSNVMADSYAKWTGYLGLVIATAP
jgi:tetratricopeptide (TPR) repeat protein